MFSLTNHLKGKPSVLIIACDIKQTQGKIMLNGVLIGKAYMLIIVHEKLHECDQ